LVFVTEETNFADWLNARMTTNNLSQSALAHELGLKSPSTVNRWVNFGARPEPLVCELLAEKFGADVVSLLRLAGHLRSPVRNRDAMGETPSDYGSLFLAEPLIKLGRELQSLDNDAYEEWFEIGQGYLNRRRRRRAAANA